MGPLLMSLDFLATSSSSVFANFVTHPFETIKVRQQMIPAHSPSFSSVLTSMIKHEGGPSSLYKGFSASLFRAIISGGGRQTIYYGMKTALLAHEERQHKEDKDGEERKKREKKHSGGVHVALGMAAGVSAAGMAAPFDMARTVLQSSKDGRGLWSVLRNVAKNEGVKGLYKGSSAVFLRQAIFNGSQLATYDFFKVYLSEQFSFPLDSMETMVLASLSSGFVTTLATSPAEMIKTQMQLTSLSMRGAFSHILKCGPLTFWRGWISLYMKLGPHTVLVLTFSDVFRELLGVPLVV